MIVVLSEGFLNKRDNVRKGVIDLISSTVDKITADEHPNIKLDKDVVVTVQNQSFSWSKYNKNHKVAVVFTKEVPGKGALTPQKQWYWSEEAQMYIIECWPATRVVTWAEGYPEFYYAFEKAMNFDYYYDLAQRAKKVEYHVVQSFDDPVFVHVRDNVKLLGCDIETRGFRWTKDPITVNGFCYEEGKIMIIPQDIVERSKENWDAFRAFVEDKDKSFIWQNGKFDTKFYRHNGWDARVDEDIMLISYALDERSGIHGLEYQATKILNTDGYKHKIDFETVDMYDKALHYYLAQDCCYTYMLFNHYMKMAEKPSHEHSFRLYRTVLLKASWALLRLEENGFYINRPYTEALEQDYRTKLIEAENNLDRIAVNAGYTPLKFQEWSGQKSLPTKFSPGAPKQLAFVLIELLDLPKYKGTLTTDAKAMMGWLFDTLDFPNKDVNEFLSTPEDVVNEWLEDSLTPQIKNKKLFLWNLLNYRKLKKMYSTYITNTLEYSKDDGRIHVTYKINGTVTGRLSSGDPMNLQNIPRKKDIKNIFKAPEGKTLIECDYSQAELRVLAYLSQDPDMINTYLQDGDLHDAVATKMFGPDFTKEQRVGAKTVNFGLAYGRGKSSVAEQLRCSYQFASDLVDQWHESMPVASAFITKTRAKPKAGERCVTPLGRERRFWLINHHNENTCENESINFPIQSLASDFALLALYKFLHILEQDPVKWVGVFPVNIVHDAILVEAPDDKVDAAVELLSSCMVEVPKEILPDLNVPMKAEAEVTKIGWGKKSEWKPGCVSELPLK